MSAMNTLKKFGLEQAFNYVYKDPDKNFIKIMDWADKFSGGGFPTQRAMIREAISDPEHPYYPFIHRLVTDIDPHVMKTLVANFFINANLAGWKKQDECREKYGCNIPWAILLDPTSACNLHCTGCWAAEYGHKLNLDFDTICSIVEQGRKMGTYMYIYTGGEPLVRKKDLMRICEKYPDCEFLSFTNGTLIDEEFCQEMLRVKNFVPAISLEGTEATTDGRRGDGVYQKVMHAMELLKSHGLPFGVSTCYTSANVDAVSSEEYFDHLIECGAYFAWFFHYMPVGNDAAVELLPTPEQREEIFHRIRKFRQTKAIFSMDFQNDAQFVGGCIAGGRRYLHINAKGDVEPCVFIHYSNANIHDCSLLDALKSPLFQAYHDNQPFNDNMLRPCPMLENPDKLGEMVKESKAVNTDYQSPETPEHLKEKAAPYAENWTPTAEKLWNKEKEKIAAGKAGVEQ